MRLRSIGDRVAPGRYRLHSRFQRAVNFTQEQRLLCLVEEEIGPGPLNVVLSGLDAAGCAPVVNVSECALVINDQWLAFSAAERYCSAIRADNCDADRMRQNLHVLGEVLVCDAPAGSLAYLFDPRRKNLAGAFERAAATQIGRGVDLVFGGQLLNGIAMLRGCGVGLTPAGDDFIAGLLIGLNIMHRTGPAGQEPGATTARDLGRTIDAVFRAAQGENVFSNAFLETAAHGRVFGGMKDLLMALTCGEEEEVRVAAQRLFKMGATSGADVATGLFMTLTRGPFPVSRFPFAAYPCLLPEEVGA